MKKLSKIAGLGLATTLAFAVQSSAQAFDFKFTLDDGNIRRIGLIKGLQDGASSPTSIEVIEGSTPISFPTTGGTFTVNSSGSVPIITNSNYSSSSFSGGVFRSLTLQDPNSFGYANSPSNVSVADTDNNPEYVETVPFSPSTNLSIVILGGMYGASRLRKTLAARKQTS